jgi:WD40 repeat protein
MLIRTFRCEPSRSFSPIDHHLALTISTSEYAMSRLEVPKQLDGNYTVALKASKDLKQVLSADDNILNLWNLQTRELLHTFTEHTSNIELIEISMDGKWALSKSATEIIIWDLQAKSYLKTITEKNLLQAEEMILNFNTEPDQKTVLVITPLSIQFWDLNKEKCLLTLTSDKDPLHNCSPAVSSDGKTALVGFKNGDLKLYDLITGKCAQTIIQDESFNYLTMSQTGNAYTVSSNAIKIWDLDMGQLIQRIDLSRHPNIDSLQISADGKKIISNNLNGSISIWHQPTGKLLEMLKPEESEDSDAEEDMVCQSISPDGTKALLTNNSLAFQFLLLSPLPHQRIYDSGMCCQSTRQTQARNLFDDLPSFVKKDVNTNAPIFPNRHAYERLCEYSTTDFLPAIAELFNRAELAKSEKEKLYFAAPAVRRFDLLAPGARQPVYDNLSALHQILGKLPTDQPLPKNYGELAFHDKATYRATHEERRRAITEKISPTIPMTRTPSTRKKQRVMK